VPGSIFGLQSSPEGDLSFDVLELIVLSVAIGVAAPKVGEPGEPFVGLVRRALAIVRKVLWMGHPAGPDRHGRHGRQRRGQLRPGVPRLARRLRRSRLRRPRLVLFVVYPVLLRAHGLSSVRYFAGAWPAIQLAFVSRSSIGTLPVTERVTQQNLGVPRS
jgi:Na+/H+-dicarboxylate symporter